MRAKIISIAFVLVITACKTEKKSPETQNTEKRTILEKIADAHGYQNWNNVEQIAFTFNVDRDSTHFERSWVWKPKANIVKSMTTKDTLVYHRRSMDSIALKVNAGFVNDRYWLLSPFNLIWDATNFEYIHDLQTIAPISKKPSQRLTIVYGKDGGYTPGDAYDFYFGDDYIIQEWVFRKANQPEPSMTTTWENYTEENGIKFAVDHKKDKENFNLYFSNIAVTPTQ